MKRYTLHLAIFFVLFIAINQVIGYYYETPIRLAIEEKTHMKYLKWTEINNSSNKYNLIFLGSSRGYCAYNPEVLDSIVKINTFNVCTGSQDIIETNYILKEIMRFQKPKYIVYEMFLPSFSSTTDFYPVLSNARFMSLSGKFEMILKGYGIDGLANYLLPIIQHQNNIRRDVTSFLFRKKRKKGILADKETTWIKGYCYNEMIVDSNTVNNFQNIYSFENTSVDKTKLNEHFINLIKICNENEIKLICVRTPYPPTRLDISPADTAGIYFENLCSNLNIPFYDFNYINDTTYTYLDTDFSDYHHMNCYGADKVSKQLGKLLESNKK